MFYFFLPNINLIIILEVNLSLISKPVTVSD